MQGIYSLHGATSSTGFSEPIHQSQPQPGKMVPHHCLFVLKRHQIRWECLLSACRCRRPPRPRGSQGLTTAVMAPIWWPASRLPTLLFMTLNKVTPEVMPFVTSTHGQIWPYAHFWSTDPIETEDIIVKIGTNRRPVTKCREVQCKVAAPPIPRIPWQPPPDTQALVNHL